MLSNYAIYLINNGNLVNNLGCPLLPIFWFFSEIKIENLEKFVAIVREKVGGVSGRDLGLVVCDF